MRDVLTVAFNEPVSIAHGEYIRVAANYRTTNRTGVVVDTARGLVHIRFDDPLRTVIDTNGRELGFVEPDPPLPTTTPDLE
ncbi:hypothetical protein [Microbacterium plantarum]|uniref:hypothetical protein n=1 Tax=Microbacterium plantarum TaxID=1816425 RepID=UPI002B467AD5|nr:hypothetical protein [Microbacterium plantarum]WRK16538.1 hypothetical protein VC184_11530 [Microbacterium plantarum]